MCAEIHDPTVTTQERQTVKTPRAIGLALALMAALMVPAAAVSQAKKPAGVPEAARKAGMARAPAVVTAAGLPCQISDARLVGEDKKAKVSYFEVACGAGAMGYIVQVPAAGAPSAFSCLEANTPPAPGQAPSAPCMLPGNDNPKALLQPMMKTAGVECIPEQARGIGQTKTSTYMEVACSGGAGYIVVASAPFDTTKAAQVQNCLMYDGPESNIKCTITDRATRMLVVDKFAAAANNGCVIKDRRFVGTARDNSTYYEASCQDGKGYIYKAAASGALADTYECAKATNILGGCELTDAREALTEQAALYTKLAKAAGSTCEVARYALFPPKPGEENVEMVCKDGSGVIGSFRPGGKGNLIVDCTRAPITGFRCSMTKDPGFAAFTADLKKNNVNSCEVSNSRVVGKTEKGTTYVEVACADKLKGYMLEYESAPAVSAVRAVGCAFAGNCKLPGNT